MRRERRKVAKEKERESDSLLMKSEKIEREKFAEEGKSRGRGESEEKEEERGRRKRGKEEREERKEKREKKKAWKNRQIRNLKIQRLWESTLHSHFPSLYAYLCSSQLTAKRPNVR